MKRLLFSMFILFSWNAFSQENSLLEKLCQNVSDSCVYFEYTYSARISGVDNHAGGTLGNQGEMWVLKSDSFEMFCDAVSLWMVDHTSKEVVIEPIGNQQQGMFLTNPARVFISISDSFRQNAVHSSDDGKSLNYSLTPKAAKDIQYLNIEIDKVTETIRNMSFALEDGTLVKIKVSSMKLTPKISDEAFRPQIMFDSKWIVTDLR